jgi:hypothetical protein
MLARLGALIAILSDKPILTGLAAFACGGLFGTLEYGIMRGMPDSAVPGEYRSAIDAAIIAAGAAMFSWVILLGNRTRRRRVREEVARIAELNHEIRNALQVIAHTQHGAETEHRDLILQSVSRIDAVLKRLFPMLGENVDHPKHRRTLRP